MHTLMTRHYLRFLFDMKFITFEFTQRPPTSVREKISEPISIQIGIFIEFFFSLNE